jgi:hypothetical protein
MSIYTQTAKTKGEDSTAGLGFPGKGKKSAKVTVAAHKRGFPGSRDVPVPASRPAGKPKPKDVSFGGAKGEVPRTNTKEPVPSQKEAEANTQAGNPGDDLTEDLATESDENREASVDDCPCGDPGCPGCIVGAMKSEKAMNSYAGGVRNEYKKSRGV